MTVDPGLRNERPTRLVPLDELKPHPQNAKGHDVDFIAGRIRQHGFTQPVLVCERTGLLAAGHGRRKALLSLRDAGEPAPAGIVAAFGSSGEATWYVPVVTGWASVDDEDLMRVVISDNQATILGGWDNPSLTEALERMASTLIGLDGLGFGRTELSALLDARGSAERAMVDPDSMPEPQESSIAEPGDLWHLGAHRVLCGDARDEEAVGRLLAGG